MPSHNESRAIFNPVQIDPSDTLADLRLRVIERSDKRAPKWKFRFAPDLIVQMQAKPHAARHFECAALGCEGAAAEMMSQKLSDLPPGYVRLGFNIIVADERWAAKVHHWRRSRTATDGRANEVWSRVLTGLPLLTEVVPNIMASFHCLLCGKGLTDPVSMARLIGPECAGTSSTSVPFVYKLPQQSGRPQLELF